MILEKRYVQLLSGEPELDVSGSRMLHKPRDVPDLQWVKVIGRPEYTIADGHTHLLVKAYSVVPIKAPKNAMLY